MTPAPVRRVWPVGIALVVGLALTLFGTFLMRSDVGTRNHRELGLISDELAAKVLSRLQTHALVLWSGAAFFAGSTTVTRQEWQRFVELSKAHLSLPGIQGIGFSLLIPPGELAPHEASVRAEGFADYRVWPPGDRPVYSSIVFLEPFAGRNLRAFGYDMFSEPVRRAAMEQARDQDLAALSGKVQLVQETGQDVQAGTLMYVPVYRPGLPVDTPAERRSALVGWVYSPYRMHDLMHGILGAAALQERRRVRLAIYDGERIAPADLLFESQPDARPGASGSPVDTATVPLDFNGHRWTLEVSRTPEFPPALGDPRVTLVAGGGTVISLLVAALLGALLQSRSRAVELAAELAARLRAEADLRERESLLRAVLDNIPFELWARDAQGRCFMENPGLVARWGSLVGTRPEDIPLDAEALACWQASNARALAGEVVDNEIEYRLTGESRTFQNIVAPIRMGETIQGTLGLNIDITERKRAQERLTYLAQHDPLTDLPNRALFFEHLRLGLARTRRNQGRLALLFIDLDHFKPINDNFGHAVGDQVLQAAARRLSGCLRASDCVGRIGGDEFVVLLEDIGDEARALALADKIRRALSRPFDLEGRALSISSSIGVALYPDHGADETELSRHADYAMYHAKAGGRDAVQVYRPGLHGGLRCTP